jgi:hypothetical protein
MANESSSGLTRREFIPLLGGAAIVTAARRTVAARSPASRAPCPGSCTSGTYTAPDVPPGGTHPSTAIGISVFRMNPRDGELTLWRPYPPRTHRFSPSIRR